MYTAISIWNGRVAPVLDSSGTFLIFEKDGGGYREVYCLKTGGAPPHETAQRLSGRGVSRLICGAASRWAEEAFAGEGIEVHSFIAGCSDAVIRAFISGEIDESFAMPGCRRRCRRRGCRNR